MNRQEFEEKLQDIMNKAIRFQEPMKAHTTFRIGGPADYFLSLKNVEQIQKVILLCKEYQVPYEVIGNGSNLLVADEGIEGVVLQLGKEFSRTEIEGTLLKAQSGSTLSALARKAAEAELTGMEFACGIPGTLGGAITMNAGAYGEEMAQIVEQVTLLTNAGKQLSLSAKEMQFGYRKSILCQLPYIVLSADLRLKKGNRITIEKKMTELNAKRKEKQPLEYPSAGSTFKRPEGYFAGKLIMEAGLAGFQYQGAQVSKKHCGFLINATGTATAWDVKLLIQKVQQTVFEKSGVKLEPEIRFLGRTMQSNADSAKD